MSNSLTPERFLQEQFGPLFSLWKAIMTDEAYNNILKAMESYAASQPLYSLEQVKEIAKAFHNYLHETGAAHDDQEYFDPWADNEGKALLGTSEPVGVQENELWKELYDKCIFPEAPMTHPEVQGFIKRAKVLGFTIHKNSKP